MPPARPGAELLSKVPEITVWFWIIKVLCTTVGETFADWINTGLGFGLDATTGLFTVIMAIVLVLQFVARRYVPWRYWLTVVVLSITGTLYTDLLTDKTGVPLVVSSMVFAVALALVFGLWYGRERTLSIHSITTRRREAFYWLTVLVTFALGTAFGDWTIELTGWGPGWSVLLPATIITIVTLFWRAGMNPVLAFWVAYILTRPLGANIGDWLSKPASEGGLGLGTFVTSLVFVAGILGVVVYLSVTRADVIAAERITDRERRSGREHITLAALVIVALATGGVLTYANAQPHTTPAAEAPVAACSGGVTPTTPEAARTAVLAAFPADQVSTVTAPVTKLASSIAASDQAAAVTHARELELAWDAAQDTLKPLDCGTWTFIDGQIDTVLTAVRAANPNPADESKAVAELLVSLSR